METGAHQHHQIGYFVYFDYGSTPPHTGNNGIIRVT
jgi:hypothetical protein